MNFQSMKSMIESIVDSYNCPECKSIVNDNNVDIIWAAWSTINIDIMCPECWKHTMVKTETLSINLWKWWLPIDILKNNWKIINKKNLIKDKEIISLNKDLKQSKVNVSDLFSDK